MTQTPTDALRLVPKYYATEPKEGGGGGYWEASIELTGGDYIAAEIYGNDREEVEERLKAALSGLLAAPASPLPGGVDRNALIDVIAEAAGWGVSSGYIKAERTADAVMAHLGLPAAPTGEPK